MSNANREPEHRSASESSNSELSKLRDEVERLRERNRELEELVTHNPQTGLPIRRLLDNRLAELSNHPTGRNGLAVAVCRLDRSYDRIKNTRDRNRVLLFKTVQRIKEIVGENVYQSDRLEEFIVLLRGMESRRMLERLGRSIIDAVTRPHEGPAKDVLFSCHLGLTMVGDSSNEGELINDAFIALEECERTGAQVVCYREDIGNQYKERIDIEKEMKAAIQNAFNGFVLYFQPIVDRNGITAGAEALIRWKHGQRGLITPGHFIPLAEETGDIRFIGQWTLYNGCRKLSKWSRDRTGPDYLSLNLAPAQFKQPDLSVRVAGIMDTLGLEGHQLMVEITEGALMDEPNRAIRTMEQLRQRGVRISIDDFGTGYSSLSYLRQFPVDTVKIDKSFIRNVAIRPDNQEIVKAIISISRALRFETVAEGVETKEDLDFLLAEGCDNFQGHYFAKALPEREFVAFVAQNRRGAKSRDTPKQDRREDTA